MKTIIVVIVVIVIAYIAFKNLCKYMTGKSGCGCSKSESKDCHYKKSCGK
ncbi:MAG: hypothetical protein ACRC6K_07215 [Fusobacteriaceae bacterium]